MAINLLVYGDISPRTAAFVIAPLLTRGDADMVLEKLGQSFVIPTKSSIVAKFRRYEALPLATTALVEGVTPTGTKPTITDYTATLAQYGDFLPYSDVIADTHDDPILKEMGALAMQQAAETVETLRYNVVKAGTQVGYANGSARTDVNTVITLEKQRVATNAILRQRGRMLNQMVSSDSRFRTEPIEASFFAVAHVDVENDIRNMQGFIPTKQYGTQSKFSNEIGAVENVRYLRSILFTPFADGGGAKGVMRSTTGTSADVYPVIYFARDAFGVVVLKGANAMSLIVHNPGSSGTADPLNQRGTLGWKIMQTSIILNDNWLYRLEVAVTA